MHNSVYQALFFLPTQEPGNKAIKYPMKKFFLKLCYGRVVCTVFQTDELRSQNAAFLMATFIMSNAAQAGTC